MQKKSMDIVEIILEDHKPLKELVEFMKNSKNELSERKAAFEEFAPTLIAHAKPEEQVLYPFLKNHEELREDGFEGEVEHMLAEQLIEECKRTKDEYELGAKIKVLAELVEHHIKEEEEDLLPEFKKNSEASERTEMGDKFLKLKVAYLAAGDDKVIPDPKFEQQSLHH